MNVTVTANLVHLCPYADELDIGEVVIVFPEAAPELHELRAYLDTWRTERITHERLTDVIASRYTMALSVTTRWRTAGMEVECSISRA